MRVVKLLFVPIPVRTLLTPVPVLVPVMAPAPLLIPIRTRSVSILVGLLKHRRPLPQNPKVLLLEVPVLPARPLTQPPTRTPLPSTLRVPLPLILVLVNTLLTATFLGRCVATPSTVLVHLVLE